MSDACINKSLPAYKMLKTRYGEFIADALVTYVTKEKGMDPKKGFYIPTTGESRDFLKKFNDNKLQSIRRGLKANPYLTTEGIADYLQGIIRKADGAYFIVKGFEYGPISKAAAVKEIFEPHLQLMETIAKEYPDIFKLVPTRQKQTIVVQITPRTQPARQLPVQQTLFQQEAAEGTPIDRLNRVLKTKLAEAGIKVEFVDSLASIYGQDIAGLYDAVKKLVQISNNKAGRDTLPEEAAHALIEALDPSNPLLTKLMNDVVYTTMYEQVQNEYADLYGANEEMYRKEALGKLVAQAWVNKYEDNPSLLRTITLLIDKVLSLFKKVDIEGMQKQINSDVIELADILLNKPITTLTQTIKPGVKELFESNPGLANSVYEALGFKSKPNVILPIGTSGSGKSTFIKSLPQENLVVIEPDVMRVEFTGDINNKSKDKEIYIEAANRAIEAIKQGKQVVFDTTNLTRDKRLPFIEAIKKAIPTANIQYKLMELNPELAKQRIKADIAAGKNRANVSDSTIDRHAESYKQMLEDIKSEPISNYEITPQQKQQAQQLYSQYLDGIFPDSKVKDIVYHNSPNKFDKFDKLKVGSTTSGLGSEDRFLGIFFTSDRDAYEGFNIKGFQYASLLNIKNPKNGGINYNNLPDLKTEEDFKNYQKQLIKDKYDGISYGKAFLDMKEGGYTNPILEAIVFEPEQIHILGSKQDIEGFKEFVKQAPLPTSGSIYYQIKPFTKSVKDILNNKLRALTVLVDKYKEQKSEKAKEYTEELRQKIDSIRSANTELGFANVLDQASKDLDKIALALRQGKYDSLESVEKAIDFVNVWEGLDMFYDEGESPLRKVAMLVEGRRRELSYILKTLHADFVSALVRETTEDAFTVDQVYEGPEDVSGYMRYLGNLASSKDPLLATVNKIYMRDVYDKTREMSNDFVAELQQKAEGITDFSFIVQKYENGKNTKNFVTKYKPEYYEALMDAVSQKPDETYEDFVLRRRQWFKENKNYDDTPIQKWEDPRYAAIQADPKKREFYEFFTSKMEEVRSWIPQSYGKANNLPLFTQAFLDDINRQGLTKAIRGLGTRFADSIRYNETAAKKLDASGDVVNSLAFYGYMEQDPSKISLDIPTILQNFYHMGLMYKHKNDVKTKIDAIVDTVRERTILEYDADGKLVEKVEGAKSNAYAQLLDWYEGIFLERFYKGAGRLKVPYPSLKKNEEGKWEFNPNALEVDTQKLAARVRGFTAIKNLALNLFSAANNITFGNLANFLEASGGQFYSKTAYREAAAEYFKSIPQRGLKSIKNAFQRKPEKITGLVDGAIHYWDFLQDQTEAEAITKGLLSKIIDFGFSLQQGGEHQIQSTVAIAILKTEKVLNKDGTEFQLNGKSVSVYDAYEIKDGKYVLKPEFKNTKLTDRNYISDLKNKIRGVNQYIHGRYNIEDAAAAQRTLLGASVLQHRKWIPSGIESRFREEYFDYRLGRKMKGRYRTYYTELPKLIMQFKFNYAAWYKSMSPIDQANMRKNFTELATAVTLIALKMLLDSMKDDDDDLKNNKAFNFAYYQLDRLQSEVYFYSVGLFTGDALAIIKDPAASLTTITNLGQIAKDLSTYAFETEEERIIDRGPFKGETKVYRDIAKLTPLVKEYYRFLNLEDEVSFYRSN